MSRLNVTRMGRLAARGLVARGAATAGTNNLAFSRLGASQPQPILRSPFSTSQRLAKPLSATDLKTAQPAKMTESEYHELADYYMNELYARFERKAEVDATWDVDYSAGVMKIEIDGKGTYVINKQPPNKQIWLSSPISGPKRYDWVVISEGQDQKQDTAVADWTYMRDGSSLNELLREETGIDMSTAFTGST